MSFLGQNTILWLLAGVGIISLAIYAAKKARRLFTKYGRVVIDALFWMAERFAGPKIRAQIIMKRYCQVWLDADSTKYLQVPGKRNVSLPVDDVFVPLSLEVAGQESAYTHANLLEAGRRLLVVGDPGSGKSTLVKWLFRDTCERARRQPRKWWLPVRLELRSLNPPASFETDHEAGLWLLDQLRESVTAIEGFEMGEFFDSLVRGSGLLVLLDGLDEVSRERYPAVAASLRGLAELLARRSSRNSIIVTMRNQFHQQVQYDLVDAYPQTLHVRPFTPNEIYVFLRRWPFEEKAEVERIYADLSDRPTLREMCTNPLILAMYVVYHRESQRAELPDTRTEFYRNVVTELLVVRRRRQTGDDQGRRRRTEREAILGELAYHNLTDDRQPANSLSWEHAVEVASRVWQCDAGEAWRRLRELSVETGLFSEERPDETFRFIHLTFCEFLAAVYAVEHERDGWRALLDRHEMLVASVEPQVRTRLVETIPFALKLMRPVDQPEALAKIAALADQLVLGRCFLESQMYGRPEWELYFAAEKAFLTSREEKDWDTTQLRRLQLFTVVVRDQLGWAGIAGEARLSELFTDIVKGNHKVLVKVFGSYAAQDATAAFRLADNIGVDMIKEHPRLMVDCCQDDVFLDVAVQRLAADNDGRWRLILAEASLQLAVVWRRLIKIKGTNTSPVAGPLSRRIARIVRTVVRLDTMFAICVQHGILTNTNPEFPIVTALSANVEFLERWRWVCVGTFVAPFAGFGLGVGVAICIDILGWRGEIGGLVFSFSLMAGMIFGYLGVRTINRFAYILKGYPLNAIGPHLVVARLRATSLDYVVWQIAELRAHAVRAGGSLRRVHFGEEAVAGEVGAGELTGDRAATED
jgi:GTPase SAR1 family protein